MPLLRVAWGEAVMVPAPHPKHSTAQQQLMMMTTAGPPASRCRAASRRRRGCVQPHPPTTTYTPEVGIGAVGVVGQVQEGDERKGVV